MFRKPSIWESPFPAAPAAGRCTRLRKAVSVLCASALLVSCISLPVYSAKAASVPSSVLSPAAAAEAGKEEVVYATLRPDGSVSHVYVVNIFELTEDGRILDYGRYTELRNLTTTDALRFSNETVTIDTKAGRLYYEGKLADSQLPWQLSFRYVLNGTEYAPDQLAGQSGALALHIQSRANPAANPAFFKTFALQITVTLDADKCKHIQAEGATLANNGGNKQITYTLLPGTDANLTLTADVTEFELNAISLNGIPMDLNLPLDDVDFDQEFAPLTHGIQQLDKGAQTLTDGTGLLRDQMAAFVNGVTGLRSGITGLTGGLAPLKAGSRSLADGALQLDRGLSRLQSSLPALTNGAAQITGGAQTLTQGIGMLAEHTATLEQGVGTLAEKSGLLPNGLTTIGTELSNVTNGLSAICDGLGDVSDGAGKLKDAAGALEDGAGKLKDGLGQSQDATAELLTGVTQLGAGAQELEEGLDTLTENNDSLISLSQQLYQQTLQAANATPKFAALGITSKTTSQQLSALLASRITAYTAEYAQSLVTDALKASAYQTAAASRMAALSPADPEYVYWQLTLLLQGEQAYQAAAAAGAATTEQEAVHQQYLSLLAAPPYNGDANAFNSTYAQLSGQMTEATKQVEAAAAKQVEDTVAKQAYAAVVTEGSYQTDLICQTLILLNYYKSVPLYAEGADDLQSGAAQLADGLATLKGKLPNLQDGTADLQDGALQLETGAGALQKGLSDLQAGIGSLQGGVDTLQAGSRQLTDGILKLKDGSLALQEGLITLKDGTAQLKDGVLNLQEGALALSDGTLTLKNGMVILENGIFPLKDGSTAILEGALALSDGIVAFGDGLLTLETGTATLLDGSVALQDGTITLHDGMITLADGTLELRERTSNLGQQLKTGISDRIDDMLGRGEMLPSFVSSKNTNVESVQFVMRTEDLTRPTDETPQTEETPQAEETPSSLWQRFLALFGG